MMKYIFSVMMFMTVFSMTGSYAVESARVTNDGLSPELGYIVISVVLLIVVAVVLTKTPARKLNE